MEDVTNEKKSHLELLSFHVLEYLDTRRDLFLLSLSEKGVALSSVLISVLAWIFFGGIILLFLGIGTAVWMGAQFDNPAAGYFIVAGIFLALTFLIIVITRNYVRKMLVKTIFKLIEDDTDYETNA